jgi:antitoxin HicB
MRVKMSAESLEDLKKIDYPVKITLDREGGVFNAEYLDLPGCSAYGDTVDEAYRLAEQAKEEWLRASLEQGLPIPRPAKTDEYSGRILVRVPAGLHALLSEQARLHGASLNQYLVHLLSSAAVGDSISTQINELRDQLSQLQARTAQISTTLRTTQSHPMQTTAIPGTTRISYTSPVRIIDTNAYVDPQGSFVNYLDQGTPKREDYQTLFFYDLSAIQNPKVDILSDPVATVVPTGLTLSPRRKSTARTK